MTNLLEELVWDVERGEVKVGMPVVVYSRDSTKMQNYKIIPISRFEKS